ncbi:MAG: HD domain-containing phosphohydrolase [Thermodesulfobacteriota bacterium]
MPAATIPLDISPLLIAISEALDLISPALVNHHRQVARIAFQLGRSAGLSRQELTDLTLAGLIHDIGGLSLASRLDVLQFDMATPEEHTLPGYLLLKKFPPLAPLARLVRFHHLPWDQGAGAGHAGEPVPRAAHLLHLADRVAILIRPQEEILGQPGRILAQIEERSGTTFLPEAVAAFREVAASEAFWFDLVSSRPCEGIMTGLPTDVTDARQENLLDLARMFRQLIDFRSRFTATHSSGVAAVAHWLAGKAGFSPPVCQRMEIAGLLHDIGKFVVPQEILEKTRPLSREDFYAIRKHPYFSQRILSQVPGFEEISQWAALHHERLDGTGYPFRLAGDRLPPGARLMAVADTFTALTEMRPYRAAMSGRGTLRAMESMSKGGKLDADLYGLVHDHLEEVDFLREEAQQASFEEHRIFLAEWAALRG